MARRFAGVTLGESAFAWAAERLEEAMVERLEEATAERLDGSRGKAVLALDAVAAVAEVAARPPCSDQDGTSARRRSKCLAS